MINTFDIDGVINMGEYRGLRPERNDIIITGRSIEEEGYTVKWLRERGIYNQIFFNNIPYNMKTRELSGWHKASTIKLLQSYGLELGIHFEDDPVQADIIEKETTIKVVRIIHDLVEKENVWHGDTNDSASTGFIR